MDARGKVPILVQTALSEAGVPVTFLSRVDPSHLKTLTGH